MSTRNRIPPAIEPYLRLPPEASLIVLTGTIGCSANWLTARFLSSFLNPQQDVSAQSDGGSAVAVVLVSWMRDFTFWKNEIRRVAVGYKVFDLNKVTDPLTLFKGLDISKLAEQRHFAFVDRLTTPSSDASKAIADTEKSITDTVNKLSQPRTGPTILVLDSPDLLLAINSATAQQLNHLILKLRSHVNSTIVACSACMPLVSAATHSGDAPASPLEIESAAFITQQSHNARFVMSVRGLDTGAARDVSGVLRITRGPALYDLDEDTTQGAVREMEALYLVQRDGTAKVFERGTETG